MKSRAFIGDFVERRDILPELMAVESWDAESGNIAFDSEAYDAASKTWVRDVEPLCWRSPRRKKHTRPCRGARISEARNGDVTVSIGHQSPVIAAQWVQWLVEDVNTAVKAQDVPRQKSIEYLKQQVALLADLQVMFELIQSQTEIAMLAEVSPNTFLRPSTLPSSRRRVNPAEQICALGSLLGCLLGMLAVLIRKLVRARV